MRRWTSAAAALVFALSGCAVVQRASVAPTGEPDGPSRAPTLSADGRYVAFASDATNLVDGDGNGVDDVFVRDRVTGTVARVSSLTGGGDADGPSRAPTISADGRYVAFESDATNLVPGDDDDLTDVFLRDRETGTTTLVSEPLPPAPSAIPAATSSEPAPPALGTLGAVGTLGGSGGPATADSAADSAASIAALAARAEQLGTVRLLATLPTGFTPEGRLGRSSVRAQRASIAAAQAEFAAGVQGAGVRILRSPRTVPVVVVEAEPRAVALVVVAAETVVEDLPIPPALAETGPLVGAPVAHAHGTTGAGTAVAILDTGVDRTHPFFGGRVVEEACYSASADCPDATTEQTGTGSAAPCAYAPTPCRHGTHVTGIAAGDGPTFDGMAPDASIIAVQVFSEFTGAICDSQGADPCPLTFTSDQLLGLEHVYELRDTYRIAAVNMSLGAFPQSSPCDWYVLKPVIDNLRAAGIATVIAAGNESNPAAISIPGCISSAVSVGATTDADNVASFSNSATFLSLLAPGSAVTSSVPGGGTAVFNGTSMATPHVTGAWALVKQRSPNAGVAGVLATLTTTGVPVTDPRNDLTKTRICISGALGLGACRAGASRAPSISADGHLVAFESSDPGLIPSDTNGVADVFVRDVPSGVTSRASVSDGVGEAHGSSTHAAISADGAMVAFDSVADDLVPSDTNAASDVFVRDRLAGTTVRASVSEDGAQLTGASNEATISGDGTAVAFSSVAPNAVAGDTNGVADVFVHGLGPGGGGGGGTTTRVSISSTGGQADGASRAPSLSADGTVVAFGSEATTLDPPGGGSGAESGSGHVYVRHRPSGLTRRASTTFWLLAGNGPSEAPTLSADGRTIAFASEASDLDGTPDTDGLTDVYLRFSVPPELTSVSPGALTPGQGAVPFTIAGAGFLPGAVVDAGPGVAVAVSTVGPNAITGTFAALVGATPGGRTVSVTNLGGPGFATGLCPGCLAVVNPGPSE